MTKKEKQRIKKARLQLLDVRNFLSEQRNKASKEDQEKYNNNIEVILYCVFDLMKAER